MKIFLFLLVAASPLFAGSIIQISHRLPMKNAEVTPKDFFLDVGEKDGVREGDTLKVFRWVPVMDAYSGLPYHLMRVYLGDLRVFQVGDAVAVGHISNLRSPDEMPAMESVSFMLGDQVDTKTDLPFQGQIP